MDKQADCFLICGNNTSLGFGFTTEIEQSREYCVVTTDSLKGAIIKTSLTRDQCELLMKTIACAIGRLDIA